MANFLLLYPAIRETASSAARHLQIFVLFNGPESTARALRAAAAFSEDLGGDILIAAPFVVPYPLPLNCPPANHQALLSQMKRCVSLAALARPVNRILIAYARDAHDGWRSMLPHGCVVILGQPRGLSPRRYFQSWACARFLRKLGHEVLVA